MHLLKSRRTLAKLPQNPILPQPAWATQLAADYPIALRSTDWVNRLNMTANWNFHGSTMATAGVSLGLGVNNVCQNIYVLKGTPDEQRKVALRWQFPNAYIDPAILAGTIPVAAGARFPLSTDGQATMADLVNGIMWNIFGGSAPWDTYPWIVPSKSFPFVAPNDRWPASSSNPGGWRPQAHGYGWPGFDPNTWCVAAGLEVIRHDDVGNLDVVNPAGPMSACVLQWEEIMAGVIRHCLAITVSGRCSMSGPLAGPEITDPEHPDVGHKVGCSCAPSRQCESRGTISTPAQLLGMVPDGMLFRVTWSDAEIEKLLDANHLTGALRATARIIMVCLRDYGCRTYGTSGPNGGCYVITDGSPQAMVLAGQCGVKDMGAAKMLYGVFDVNHMDARRPMEMTLVDGSKTRREGAAKLIGAQ